MAFLTQQHNSGQEKEAVYRFRYSVCEKQGQFPATTNHKKGWIKDGHDEQAVLFALTRNDEIVASIRILELDQLPETDPYIANLKLKPALDAFGRAALCIACQFWIEPDFRAGKAFNRFMRDIYKWCLDRAFQFQYVESSPNMIPFLEHLGFRRYVDHYFETEFGFKVPLVLLLRDHGYLYESESPLYRLTAHEPDDDHARYWFRKTYPEFLQPAQRIQLEEQAFFDLFSERLATQFRHNVSILHGLTQVQAELFLTEAKLVPTKPGDVLVKEGDLDASLFVILSGLCQVIKAPDLSPLAVLGAGDTFGEMSLLTTSPRCASVIAKSQGKVLVLDQNFVQGFIERQPGIASKILFNLAKQLASRLALSNTH